MIYLNNRIYYNQNGKVLWQTGEHYGDVLPHLENEIISYIDLPYGDKTLDGVKDFHIENSQIVIDGLFELQLTPEQQRIIELEEQLAKLQKV